MKQTVRDYLLDVDIDDPAVYNKGHTCVITGVNLNSQERVAVKVADVKAMNSSQQRAVNREVEIMQALNGYPNVIKFYESFEVNGKLFLVMQYVESDLLTWFKNNSPINEKTVKKIFSQIASALSTLHNCRIAHCDLKLENILYDEKTQTVYLIDFGSSKKFEKGKKKLTGPISTPYYIAPEVFLQKTYNAFLTDIYSLGVILYVLYFGVMPFTDLKGEEYYSVLFSTHFQFSSSNMRRNDLHFPNPKASSSLKSLLSSLLHLIPEARPSIDSVVKNKWVTPKTSLFHFNKTK